MCVTEKRDVCYASEKQGLKTHIKARKIKVYIYIDDKRYINKRKSEHIKSLSQFESELHLVKE